MKSESESEVSFWSLFCFNLDTSKGMFKLKFLLSTQMLRICLMGLKIWLSWGSVFFSQNPNRFDDFWIFIQN